MTKRNTLIKLLATTLNMFAVLSFAQSPVSSFVADQTSGCSPLSVTFTNSSLGATGYYWDFGNGNTSVIANPSNVYSAAGTYNVKLVSIATNGQKDTVIYNNLITVSSNSVPGFQVINTAACLEGNVFSFVNTSINAVNYLWDFGDGTTSGLQNPTHSYLSQGDYTVKLISYDSYGCPNINIKDSYIHVKANPVAEFTANTTVGCNLNQSITFTSATPSVNGWLWNFGDGSTSTLHHPSHVYTAPGTYSVSLAATTANGCSNSITMDDYISVVAPQLPAFSSTTTAGCLTQQIVFTNNSVNSVEWLWNFGDGTTATDENPTHIYQNSGNFAVSLTITTDNNCVYSKTKNNYINIANNAVSQFIVSNPGGCAPVNVYFTNQSTNAATQLWDFGDGTTSAVKNPLHSYFTNGVYTVTLHSYNTSGCEAVFQKVNSVVLALPQADFSASYTPGCAPLIASFNNTSVNSVQWLWDFGDGTFSNLKNPAHTYNLPGDYDVRLIASNVQGCSDTLTLKSYIHIINTAGDFISPAPVDGCVPYNATFANNSSGAVSWLWNFGDGQSSAIQNPTHTYLTSGVHTVSLTVQLVGGCTQFYANFRTFNLKGGQSEFSFTAQSQCPPYIESFTGTISSNAASHLWDFGDGSVSTQANPQHTYANPGFYTVKYSEITSEGCTSTSIENNCIHFVSCSSNSDTATGGSGEGGNVFSENNTNTNTLPFVSGCVPFNVHFNNTLSGTISWLWNFGDGTTSSAQNPYHTYTTKGNYTVTLVAQNASGLSNTVLYADYIHAFGTDADFSSTVSGDCQNTTFAFNGVSQNATIWNWNFGDGSTSTQQNPVHTYSNSLKNYTIELTSSTADGCSATLSKSFITSHNSPSIWADNYSACYNSPIQFSCFSSDYVSYLWSFGDGATSAIQSPAHSYLASGSYQVTLTLTDNQGCIYKSLLQNLITVKKPEAVFNYTLVNGCNSQNISFSNLAVGTSLPVSSHSKWNFGDGTLEQLAGSPIHNYSTPGTYQVTLTVDQGNKCFSSITKTIHAHPVDANFSFTQNSSCFPITAVFIDSSSSSAVSWLWDFGDGTTSALQNPTHTFTTAPAGEVTLTVFDVNGCQAVAYKPNIINFDASFSVSAEGGCAPLNVEYYDGSVNANQWKWFFGDGTTSSLQNPVHTYIYNGTYPIMLISKSIDGCMDTMTFNSITTDKPVANFISQNPTNCSPTLVSFTDLSTSAVSWLWDFGDGSTSVSQHPAHIYNIPGFYTIKLIVTNTFGCNDTLVRVNYIEVPGTIADFNVSASQLCAESTVQFTDNSINATTWDWNFGDGNSSSQKNPVNTYINAGQYTVSLIVHNSQGCTSNFTFLNPIIVKPSPTADFSASDSVSCTPFAVSLQNNSQNAVSYFWNFGDGTTSALQNPSHTYLNSGAYSIVMTATNQFGCSASKTIDSIVSLITPVAEFSANITQGCSPLVVNFTGSGDNVQDAQYSWDFGNGVTSTQRNPSATFLKPGFYSVSFIIINNTGCMDTIVKTAYIEVYDFNPPAPSAITLVTVSSNASVQLFWNQSTAADFAFYKIYRKDILTGNYLSIGTVSNNAITTYTDIENINTLMNSYCYKVQTIDNCGYALPLDSLEEHCTINVTATGSKEDIKVSWTPYIGANAGTYTVYRMEAGSSVIITVATVASSVLSIVDTTLECPVDFSYRIRANNLNGHSISSNSDTSIAKPASTVLIQQKVDVVRSTVIGNSKVLTEWKTPAIEPAKVTGYSVFRSTDNIEFTLLANVSSSEHEYMDEDVNVDAQNYYYTVKAVNSCSITTRESNKSSSVLLSAELVDGTVNLNWTSYEGWNMGVDHYMIEKLNNQGEWELIKKVDGNTLFYNVK